MDKKEIDKVFLDLDKDLLKILCNRLNSFNESLLSNKITIEMTSKVKAQIIKIFLFSEFLASSLINNPHILKELIDSKDLENSYSKDTYQTKLLKKINKGTSLIDAKTILLQTKLYESIRIAWRDLTQIVLLEETLLDLSNLADAIVSKSVQIIYNELGKIFGFPIDTKKNIQEIIVLGMGKLGAQELNFSSDIDLIFIYPEQGYTNGENPISNEEFFTRLCRKFLKFFSVSSHEINFYRTDTRLRPFGDGGPIVMSSLGFEEYYQTHGREWERYAMIKARPIAGDIKAGFKLLKKLNPFIYRRYFDYGSFDSFRDMKNKIKLQVRNKKLKNNIKIGAGGIRQIEFFVQLFQLIRGGVEPKLQERKVLKVLELLEKNKSIDEKAYKDLKKAYIFLRMTENRLQIYADLQTHDLPFISEQKNILSYSMGYNKWDDFADILNNHMQKVHYHFNLLLKSGKPQTNDEEIQAIKELWINIDNPQYKIDFSFIKGFKDPKCLLNLLKSLEEHPNTKSLTSKARGKLNKLIPLMIKQIGKQTEPDKILIKLIDLIITIERRTCYLSLLIENKMALKTLIDLASQSPWIITFLSNHPALLDELMNPASLYFPPDMDMLTKEIKNRMEDLLSNDDIEFFLEQLCIFKQINTLRVAAADISNDYPLMKVSDHLTYIAQIVLEQVLQFFWNLLVKKYGMPEQSILDTKTLQNLDYCGFAIIAYGKVGGLEMGYKSDIDIVFLHKASQGVTQKIFKAKGTKNKITTIENIRFYSNLSQRIINALTIHTAAGTLYGTDMRLRPSGSAGTIVSHIKDFEEYLLKKAWTWEHQALIKARHIVGDKDIFAQFDKIRKKVLRKKRKRKELKKQVKDMREKIRTTHLKHKKDYTDLKQSKGCIMDIEFLVQYLILENANTFPYLTTWTDNIRLLEALCEKGITTKKETKKLQEIYIFLRKKIHRQNLKEKQPIILTKHIAHLQKDVIEIYEKYLS